MSDYLCEELIIEILTRLPPKSLLRFRSLSKSWYSCISSPSFIRMHTFQSPRKLLFRLGNSYKNEEADFFTVHGKDELPLCLERGYIGITAVQFPFGRGLCIIGSCNGVLCLCVHEEKSISLWNPSIRRKRTLPHCPRGYSLWVGKGFGFDPISDDYKIVSIPYVRFKGKVDISYVYTLKTGTWCAITSPMPWFYAVASSACFVNGALHWLVQLLNTASHDDGPFSILTFDLSTHVFGLIPLPDSCLKFQVVGIIQGSLAVVSTDENGDNWIWVRRDASWSVIYKSKTTQVGGGIYGGFQPTSNGDFLFHAYSQGFQVLYPIISAHSKLVDYNAASHISYIVLFVESLQLLVTDMVTTC